VIFKDSLIVLKAWRGALKRGEGSSPPPNPPLSLQITFKGTRRQIIPSSGSKIDKTALKLLNMTPRKRCFRSLYTIIIKNKIKTEDNNYVENQVETNT
jgi:hypothetical protein